MQLQFQDVLATRCVSNNSTTSHPMFLRRMKHKAKLLSSSGSLQHIEDECEVESQGSLDSGIRQGNLRYLTSSNSVVEAEVQGTLKTGRALGFGMLRTCRCW
ncbi:hypothetical protein NC651_040338 [Populus alba x Populus x berolinensis]|nr:hypothetical protein NC651_040338 [Populus alba x Populus x berolinensis]